MNSRIIAGRSGQALDVTRFPSTTTSASMYSAPAFSRSGFSATYAVALFPLNISGAVPRRTRGPWHMAAIGFEASTKCLTISLALGWRRIHSGALPPGMTSPSNSSGLISSNDLCSHGNLYPGFSLYVSHPGSKSWTTVNMKLFSFFGAATTTSKPSSISL